MTKRNGRQWKWRSYRAMVGTAPRPGWLQTDWVLGQFGVQRARQIDRYIEFDQESVRGPQFCEQLKGQIYLGSEAFVETMQRELEAAAKHTVREIPRLQRHALEKSLDYCRNAFENARTGMAATYATGNYTLQAIADAFGVHYSTVSRTVSGKWILYCKTPFRDRKPAFASISSTMRPATGRPRCGTSTCPLLDETNPMLPTLTRITLRLACLALACATCSLHAQTGPVTSSEIESPPNGLRGFRSSVDLRFEYQNLVDGGYRYITTPRLKYAINPDVALRVETPYVTGSQSADAPRSSGLGDLLVNGAWRAIKGDGFAVVFATDLISDTTRDVRLGSGKAVVAPTVYAAIDLPGHDSVFFPSVQHYASLSRGESGTNVSLTSIRLGVLTHWSDRVYTFLDPRFIVDWERSAKVGLTVELEVGRKLENGLSVWVRPGIGVLNREALPTVYNWNVEVGTKYPF